MNKIKLAVLNNRNIIRIVRYVLISFALLWVSWLFDYHDPGLKKNLPGILLLSSEVTSSFLSNLSGTFLTVTTFTFTTILTVLGKYSGSFTPRIVQDFIDKPNVLSLFGIYVGGFFYTVLALFMVQNITTVEVPLVCGTIAIFYAMAAMVAFVLFVRRVLSDIKVSSVLENIYDKALHLIEEEAKKRKASERFERKDHMDEIQIYANKTGFLYDIDSDLLLDQLDEIKCECVVTKRIGQYVSKGVYIAKLNIFDDFPYRGEEKEEFLNKLSTALLINETKNDVEDYHHEITNLVEIAMMALSPGTNDPNTSIDAIGKLSLLLGKLFSTDNFYVVLKETEDTKVIYNGYTVKEELCYSFAQIIHYGKADPMVSLSILNGIYRIYMIADRSVKKAIEDYMTYAYKVCREAMDTELDREQLDSVYDDFYKNRDEHSDDAVVRSEE